MATILVSGFGPWGGIDENPTALVLDRLAADPVPGLVTLRLPVETRTLRDAVDRALDEHRPALWVGLGLAMGSATVAVERIAANLCDFAEPDIAGAQPKGARVVEGGPAGYLVTWPSDAMLARLRAGGIPARASSTAGTFLCNQLLYLVLHGIERRGLPTRAGFLHMPAHPALVARGHGRQAEHPSMAVDLQTRAVRLAIDTALGG